jgi:hypothetical protein
LFRTVLLTRLPYLVVFIALLLLTWVAAHWTWVFLSPSQNPQLPLPLPPNAAALSSKVLAERVVTFNLFGGEARALTGAADEGGAEAEEGEASRVAVAANIVIRGLYSARNGRAGFAVLVMDGKPIHAVAGTEFAPGMILQRVYPDSIEVLRGQQVEVIRMAAAPAGGSGAVADPAQAGGKPVLQMQVRDLGPRQYGFSRAALLALLKRADQMTLLGRYGSHPRGGAVLERSPDGGLPARLGLKVGDVIVGINGKALSGSADVARLYELLTKSERVSVDILRAGEKMNYGIQVTP